MTPATDLGAAIDGALHAVDQALAKGMQTMDGASAEPHLEHLRDDLHAMRARGVVGADELRTIIRGVARWAPEDDVSLLSALGVIARTRGN